jgi:hypothetical protein
MKWAIIILVLIWLLCGVVGAWILDDLNARHWKTIALGPITLVHAVNGNPVSIPNLG